MRRMLTSLTPDTSVEFKVNHGKDSIKHERTYSDSDQDPIFDEEGNLIEVIELGVREEAVRYVWNFVECRHCYRRYVLERNNDSEDEEEKTLYPLFYGAK
ncbi:hypothetical protein [Cylindrospermum sp. FACHB-282]|uniref:hypothetical protein n=1 Tax=Cylindrospermum sp. FACHB-282 TaxID=2692794 RepID=UPI0016876456|nr:hypothetical protein [Cylindrospermum sp. FACHB-282]MBD2388100.1 hypothetical protein [Cylindrospermum sp. FACHB-282]